MPRKAEQQSPEELQDAGRSIRLKHRSKESRGFDSPARIRRPLSPLATADEHQSRDDRDEGQPGRCHEWRSKAAAVDPTQAPSVVRPCVATQEHRQEARTTRHRPHVAENRRSPNEQIRGSSQALSLTNLASACTCLLICLAAVGQAQLSTLSTGTALVVNTGTTRYVTTAMPTATVGVVCYSDWSNNKYGTCNSLGLIGSTLSKGEDFVFRSDITKGLSVVMPSISVGVACYVSGTYSVYGYCSSLSMSGSTLSKGTSLVLNTGNAGITGTAVAMPSTTVGVVCHYGTAGIGCNSLSLSGSTLSKGAVLLPNGQGAAESASVSMATTTVGVVCYCDYSHSTYYSYFAYGTCHSLSLSGSTLSNGASLRVNTGSTLTIRVVMASTTIGVVCSTNYPVAYARCKSLSLSGSTLSQGTEVTMDPGDGYSLSVAMQNTTAGVVCYTLRCNSFSLSGFTLTMGAPLMVSSTLTSVSVAMPSVAVGVLCFGGDTGKCNSLAVVYNAPTNPPTKSPTNTKTPTNTPTNSPTKTPTVPTRTPTNSPTDDSSLSKGPDLVVNPYTGTTYGTTVSMASTTVGVMCYQGTFNNGDGTCNSLSLSGSTLSKGADFTVKSRLFTSLSVSMASTTLGVVCFNSNSGYGTCHSLSLSGSALSKGPDLVLDSSTPLVVHPSSGLTSNLAVVMVSPAVGVVCYNNGAITCNALGLSGSSLSKGSGLLVAAPSSRHISVAMASTVLGVVCHSSTCTSFSVSSSVMSKGAHTLIGTGTDQVDQVTVSVASTGVGVVCYSHVSYTTNSASPTGRCSSLVLGGSAPSLGSNIVVSPGVTLPTVAMASPTTAVVCYTDTSQIASFGYGTCRPLRFSGSGLTMGGSLVVSAGITYSLSMVMASSTGGAVCYSGGTDGYGTCNSLRLEDNKTPTKAPTPTPTATPITTTVVSQGVTYGNLDASTYTGTVKEAYEKGYGVAIGACSSPCSSYTSGVSVSSSAASARRASKVTYTTTLTGLTSTAAATYSSGCAGSCTAATLQTSIEAVAGSTDAIIGTVTVTTIDTATSTTASETSETSSSDDATVIVIVVVVVVVGVCVLVAVSAGVYCCCRSKKASTGTADTTAPSPLYQTACELSPWPKADPGPELQL